jgi:uncharacterized protein involved in exopolysaccharide biosynthesis
MTVQPEDREIPGSNAQGQQPALKDGKVTPLASPLSVRADDEIISLLELWRILRSYKKMILATTLLGFLATAIAALLMTPVYRAEVVLAPVTESEDRTRLLGPLGELSGIAALAGADLQRGGRKNEAIAVLQSRLLTEKFIKDEKLLPVLFGDRWVGDDSKADGAASADAPTLSEAYELFDEKIRRVYEDRKTGMVVLAVEWEDPLLAASWANNLVQRANATMRQRSTEESRNAIRYLEEQLKATSAMELQQVLHRLIESEMKEIILANVNEAFAFRVIDPAAAPDKPFRPAVVLMMTLGVALGLVAGVILALFVNFTRTQKS